MISLSECLEVIYTCFAGAAFGPAVRKGRERSTVLLLFMLRNMPPSIGIAVLAILNPHSKPEVWC